MNNFYTMKEVTNLYIDGCHDKVAAPVMKIFIKAVLAGAMIALGAEGSSVAAHAVSNVGLARLTAAVVFPVGLMMVILTGAELFTGDCLIFMGAACKKHSVGQLIKMLVIVFLGNFLGAFLIAAGVAASGQLDYSAGLLGAYTIKIALGKATIPFGKAVVSGILCNILVCAAVVMAMCAKDISGKLLVSFFVILLFVTSGFEHCVANMYYISAGLLAALNPAYVQAAMTQYGYTAEQLAQLNVQGFLVTNLVPVTLGNIIGGMLCVGLPLVYLYHDKEKAA